MPTDSPFLRPGTDEFFLLATIGSVTAFVAGVYWAIWCYARREERASREARIAAEPARRAAEEARRAVEEARVEAQFAAHMEIYLARVLRNIGIAQAAFAAPAEGRISGGPADQAEPGSAKPGGPRPAQVYPV